VPEASLEEKVAQAIRKVLAAKTVGEQLVDDEDLQFAMAGLEWYLPGILCEVYPEWCTYTLDGILPTRTCKTGLYAPDVIGLCILINDQTTMPIRVRLKISPAVDEITWLECMIGEDRGHGRRPVRTPYNSDRIVKQGYSVLDRADSMEWHYKVTFGDKSA